MTTEIAAIRDAILRGAPGEEIGALPLPATVRGALVKADEQEMFDGLDSADKDPRKSIHVEEFPLPELAPDEAFVGRHGVGDQLQHGVDVDLRAAPDLRLPEAPRARERVGETARPAVPGDGFRREWCRVAGRAPRCGTGSRATS